MRSADFYIVRADTSGRFHIHGSYKFVKYHQQSVEMSDGKIYPIKDCFHTKGGATKSVYRRNYALRTQESSRTASQPVEDATPTTQN